MNSTGLCAKQSKILFSYICENSSNEHVSDAWCSEGGTNFQYLMNI